MQQAAEGLGSAENSSEKTTYAPEGNPSVSAQSTGSKTPHRKRSVSERKIEANRRNSLRSTGPRTARGKRTVARNALKHGLLAREVVITAGDGVESLEEFQTLLKGLWEEYEPVGIVEEYLVQTIATCLWRKARVIRAENGEIRKGLDTLAMDQTLRDLDKGNFDVTLSIMQESPFRDDKPADQKFSTRERYSALQVSQTDLRGHSIGLWYVSALLQTAKSEIASDGHISKRSAKKIFWAFSLWDSCLAFASMWASPLAANGETTPLTDVGDKEADNVGALLDKLIDSRLGMIKLLEEHAEEREKLAEDAEARRFSLPPAKATDKLLRYEAHPDRQLYRAMDQLERLQRQRRGENVPPPLNINLSRRR